MSNMRWIETAAEDDDAVRLPSDKCRLVNGPPDRLVPRISTRIRLLNVEDIGCKRCCSGVIADIADMTLDHLRRLAMPGRGLCQRRK